MQRIVTVIVLGILINLSLYAREVHQGTNPDNYCDNCEGDVPEINTQIENIQNPLEDISQLVGFMNKKYILHDKNAVKKVLIALRKEYKQTSRELGRELFQFGFDSEKKKLIENLKTSYDKFFVCLSSQAKILYGISHINNIYSAQNDESEDAIDRVSSFTSRLIHVALDKLGFKQNQLVNKCEPAAESVLGALEEIRDHILVEKSNHSITIERKPANKHSQ